MGSVSERVDVESKSRAGMRHCMVVLAYYPRGETRVQREAEALVARGHEVDVICLRSPRQAATENHHGVQIHRVRVQLQKGSLRITFLNYLRFFAAAAIELARLNRRRRYDVVQVHNLPDFLVFSALIPKLQGTSVILDLHDLMPEFYSGRFAGNGRSKLAQAVLFQEKMSCRFADHVITVSDHWREALIKRGVPAGKCSVVMNVADDKIFYRSPGGNKPRNDNEFRLIYHGTIVYRYGLDLAIRAVDQDQDQIPNIRLTISGAGDYVDELIRLARDLGLEQHVTVRSEMRPVEELPEMIRAADLGVVPYRNDLFTDGLLPTKLMEYLAMGLPCVAARTTAIEKYFDSSVDLFEPGSATDLADHILALYGSPERLRGLSESSLKFQERYNWPAISSEYVRLVERLGNHTSAVTGDENGTGSPSARGPMAEICR